MKKKKKKSKICQKYSKPSAIKNLDANLIVSQEANIQNPVTKMDNLNKMTKVQPKLKSYLLQIMLILYVYYTTNQNQTKLPQANPS
jgi:transcriptional regulator CtsR